MRLLWAMGLVTLAGCRAASVCEPPGSTSGVFVLARNSEAYVAEMNKIESDVPHIACRAETTIETTVVYFRGSEPLSTGSSDRGPKGNDSNTVAQGTRSDTTAFDPRILVPRDDMHRFEGQYRVLGVGRGIDADDCASAAMLACNEAADAYFRKRNAVRPLGVPCRVLDNRDRCPAAPGSRRPAIAAAPSPERSEPPLVTLVRKLDDDRTRADAIRGIIQFFENAKARANGDVAHADVKALVNRVIEPMTKAYADAQLDARRAAPSCASSPKRATRARDAPGSRHSDRRTTPSGARSGLAPPRTGRAPPPSERRSRSSKPDPEGVEGEQERPGRHDRPQGSGVEESASRACRAPAAEAGRRVRHGEDRVPERGLLANDLRRGPRRAARREHDPSSRESSHGSRQGRRRFLRAARHRGHRQRRRSGLARRSRRQRRRARRPVEVDDRGSSGKWQSAVAAAALALGEMGRADARDALVRATKSADHDANRAALALALTKLAPSADAVKAFQAAYEKLAPGAMSAFSRAAARPSLLDAAAGFYDPALVPWLLRQVGAAKGPDAEEVRAAGVRSALLLMRSTHAPAVRQALDKFGTDASRESFRASTRVVESCDTAVDCYVAKLGDAENGAESAKAASMLGVFGDAKAAPTVVERLARIPAEGRRAALAALDHLVRADGGTIADAIESQANESASLEDRAAVHRIVLRLRAR